MSNAALFAPAERLVLGSRLTSEDRKFVLGAFVHRFTGEHQPQWARTLRPDGTAHPLQFSSDADWLANTKFVVRPDGRLNHRYTDCVSTPTWPNNPELRRPAAEPVLA